MADLSGGDVGSRPRRATLVRAMAAVLRIGPLRWLTAELIPLGFLAIGAAITWMRPDYAIAGLMVGAIVAPALGFLYLYKTLGASVWWVLPLALGAMGVSLFGAVAIPSTLLAHRGHRIEAITDNVTKHPSGGWDCTFKRSNGTPIPGTETGCDEKANSGDHVTLILDPWGQIPPVSAPLRANPVANPVVGVTSAGLLVLAVAGAAANGEHWIRRHSKTWTLYERLVVQRGNTAHLWLRR
ncbi:MAG: hypothetical protein WCF33_11560 [Pseudonocardiaceae bacterium]